MCAAVAGQRGRRVLVVDHADEPGKKILISGGGCCNFTNRDTAPDRFVSSNPHFARSALARYTPHDFLALVERHAIDWREKTLGQLFCLGSARQMVAMLMDECAAGGVSFSFGRPVSAVDHADGRYRVTTSAGAAEAPALVVATGGPSIPQAGRDRLRLRPRAAVRAQGGGAAPGAGAADAGRRRGAVPRTVRRRRRSGRLQRQGGVPRGGAVHP